jgi:hypothetical protein
LLADGLTNVSSEESSTTVASGVPSSVQKLRFESVNVRLQVGQRFTLVLSQFGSFKVYSDR